MGDLEQRVQRLEDRVALADLSTRYFLASDFDDYDAIADAFTEDGVFSADGFEGGRGNLAIAESIRAARENFGVTVHTPHYSLVTFVDDDNATGLVGAHLEIAVGGTTLFAAVRYEDVYERVHGAWRFKSRSMRTVHAGSWSDVATSLTTDRPIRWPGTEPQPSTYSDGAR